MRTIPVTIRSWRFPVCVLLLSTTLAASLWTTRDSPERLAQPLESIETRIAGWELSNSPEVGARVLERLRPTATLSRIYRKDDRQLGLFIAYYAQQRAGESMHSPRHCLPGSGWEIWRREAASVRFLDRPVKINKYFIQNGGRHMVIYYWYQSGARIVANEYLGKLLLARDALLDGRTAGSIVRIDVPDTPESAAEGLQFAAAIMAHVQNCFAP
jgi:EpsI family protein